MTAKIDERFAVSIARQVELIAKVAQLIGRIKLRSL
jgi:hypothetical protein